MTTQPSNPDSSAPLSASERLDSWKEIAVYLKREIRTVQRWEALEELPIHRHQHRRQGSVYAYKAELDSWWHNHISAVEVTECADATSATAETASDEPVPHSSTGDVTRISDSPTVSSDAKLAEFLNKPSSRVKAVLNATSKELRVMILAALVGIALLLALSVGHHSANSPIASTYVSGNRLVALATDGTIVWTHVYDRAPLRLQALPILNGGSCGMEGKGAIVVLAWGDGENDGIDCFANSGTLLWHFDLKDTLTFGSERFGPPWHVRAMTLVRAGSETKLAVGLHHDISWPGVVVLIDSHGNTSGRFVNSGWIMSLSTVQGGAGALLLAGGVSNSADGAMLAVLDPKNISGTSPERVGGNFECKDCGPGHPLKYFVFSRSEINKATGAMISFTDMDRTDKMPLCRTREIDGSGHYGSAEGIMAFSSDLELVSASYSDRYWDIHRELEATGLIKHTVNQCPDRNGPRLIQSWDPQNGWKEVHPSSIGKHAQNRQVLVP